MPLVGRLVAMDDVWEPFRLVDGGGAVVVPVRDYLRDLQAAGRSSATARSYGMDLLRWFRFLWAVDVAVGAGRRGSRRGTSAAGCWWPASRPGRTGATTARRWNLGRTVESLTRRRCGRTARRCCAASTTSTWTSGSGPILNPFPLDRARRGGERTRITTRWSRSATSAAASTGRGCRPGSRAASRTSEFNEIFARLPSHRDRALVAFYVSTGARASELLSATSGGVDPGRQLITVVRKGTREVAGAAGLDGRVRLAAALPGRDGGADPARAAPAAVVDTAPPGRGR